MSETTLVNIDDNDVKASLNAHAWDMVRAFAAGHLDEWMKLYKSRFTSRGIEYTITESLKARMAILDPMVKALYERYDALDKNTRASVAVYLDRRQYGLALVELGGNDLVREVLLSIPVMTEN